MEQKKERNFATREKILLYFRAMRSPPYLSDDCIKFLPIFSCYLFDVDGNVKKNRPTLFHSCIVGISRPTAQRPCRWVLFWGSSNVSCGISLFTQIVRNRFYFFLFLFFQLKWWKKCNPPCHYQISAYVFSLRSHNFYIPKGTRDGKIHYLNVLVTCRIEFISSRNSVFMYPIYTKNISRFSTPSQF